MIDDNPVVRSVARAIDGAISRAVQGADATVWNPEAEFERFREAREKTLAALAPLTAVQASWSPGEGKWSILQIGDHLLLSEEMFRDHSQRLLQAVAEGHKSIAISLSDKVDETRGALERVAGGGGWRLFDRLKGAWGGMSMTGRWIDGIGDLPRARYFVPPRIGTTVTITIAALWLVPISIVVALFALIGTIAGSL